MPTTKEPQEERSIEELEARIRDLEASLGQCNLCLAVHYNLTPLLNNLLGLLYTQHSVTDTMVRQRLEIATDTKVAIHRLRKHMKPRGIEVHGKRGIGYWLDKEAKDRIRAVLEQSKLEVQAA